MPGAAVVVKPRPTAQAKRLDPELARRAHIAGDAIKHISNGKALRARILLSLLVFPSCSLTDLAKDLEASLPSVFRAVRAMSKGRYETAAGVIPPSHPELIHLRPSNARDVLCSLTPKGRDIALALLGEEAENSC